MFEPYFCVLLSQLTYLFVLYLILFFQAIQLRLSLRLLLERGRPQPGLLDFGRVLLRLQGGGQQFLVELLCFQEILLGYYLLL